MVNIIILMIIIFSSSLSFADNRISSYTDENGNKIYTTEKQSPATPPKPQYRPIFDYQESAKQLDTTIYKRKSIPNNKSVSQNTFNANPSLTPQVNPMNQPDFSRSFNMNPFIEQLSHQIAFMLTLVIILFVVWLVALIDILRSEFAGSNKLIWFLTVTFLPVIGSVLYFIIGKGQKVIHHEPPNNQELNIRTYNKPKI